MKRIYSLSWLLGCLSVSLTLVPLGGWSKEEKLFIPDSLIADMKASHWQSWTYSKIVSAFIARKDPAARQQMIDGLAKVLTDKKSTSGAKAGILRAFLSIGFPRDLTGVEACLSDPETQTVAYTVLSHAASGKVLDSLWKRADATGRCAILNGWAMQGDAERIAARLGENDPAVARTAYFALGRVGSEKALDLLVKGEPAPALKEAWYGALANTLDQLAQQKKIRQALPVARKIFGEKDIPEIFRAAAARVIVLSDPSRFPEMMRDPSTFVRQAVIRAGANVEASYLIRALKGAGEADQIAILGRIEENRDKAGVGACLACLDAKSERVASVAMRALGVIGESAHLEVIIPFLSRKGRLGEAAFYALTHMQDERVAPILFKLAEKNRALIPVLGERAQTALIGKWKPLIASPEIEVRKEAWRAISRDASPEIAPTLVGWLEVIRKPEVNLAESTILASVRNMENGARSRMLQEAWRKSGSVPARRILAGLMDAFYSKENLPLLLSGLKEEKSAEVRERVIETLGNWKSLEPLEALMGAYAVEGDAAMRRNLVRASLKLIAAYGGGNRAKLYGRLFLNAEEKDHRYIVLAMSPILKTDAFTLLKELAADKRCGESAKRCYVNLYDTRFDGSLGEKELDRKGWKLNASVNAKKLEYVKDNKINTCWATSRHSVPGMWVSVDLGAEHFVTRALLDTSSRANDTPNGCEVFISADGKKWTGPVASAGGNTKKLTGIKVGKKTRYLKFVTTGGRHPWCWSICELRVWGGMDARMADEIKKSAEAFRK